MSIIKISKKGNKVFGFFKESELKISQLDHERIDSMNLDTRIISIVNFCRQSLNHSVRVNSCGRTVAYNSSLSDASPTSYHLIRNDRPVSAMDTRPVNNAFLPEYKQIIINNIDILKGMGLKGLGFYPTFVHMDVGAKVFKTWGIPSDLSKKLLLVKKKTQRSFFENLYLKIDLFIKNL